MKTPNEQNCYTYSLDNRGNTPDFAYKLWLAGVNRNIADGYTAMNFPMSEEYNTEILQVARIIADKILLENDIIRTNFGRLDYYWFRDIGEYVNHAYRLITDYTDDVYSLIDDAHEHFTISANEAYEYTVLVEDIQERIISKM